VDNCGSPRINQIACTVHRVCWSFNSLPCDRCQQPAGRVWAVMRTAIDIDLDGPVLLAVDVSVHYCRPCEHYFRAQPPFLRPDALYAQRVVCKAIQSVYQDGMAMRRVPERLARDFWVQPSEKMVRLWCRTYATGLPFDTDYQPWIAESFSGVLCVDEVYQGDLALLLAVDPAAPDGDRLVGYQLVRGAVDQTTTAAFLRHLAAAGIHPDQVITDGSALYPTLLAAIWPTAAHQLCLFHETRRVTMAAAEVIRAVRKALPKPPPATRQTLGGRPRRSPPPPDATDAASERWRWREASRQAGIREAHELRDRGVPLRAIARQLGVNRRTVRAWLAREAPPGADAPDAQPFPPRAAEVAAEAEAPPTPWASWQQVRELSEALKRARFWLLRRPDHLTAEQQAALTALLASPIGGALQVARDFLVDWYALWRDERGRRRSPAEAWTWYEAWQANPGFAAVAPLRRVQDSVDADRFRHLSYFLTHADWEATNNGAERMGRAFRHLSAPHFTLRTTSAVDAALKVRACLRKEASTSPTLVLPNRCPRGRPARSQHLAQAA
jgi:Homeodomain-like domain